MKSPRKKPVILLTVYRRYFELSRAIQRIRELTHEFAFPPEVVVIWAQPEPARAWFFDKLIREGHIKHLLTRKKLDGESPQTATTYAESHNLRIGLEFIRDHYDPDTTYAICQAADVWPNNETCYGFIDKVIQGGDEAVVMFWSNGCVNSDIWHTNMFAVPLDEEYWPPVARIGDQDVLERQWGLLLKSRQPPLIHKTHNNNNRRFLHEHLSEHVEEWPRLPIFYGSGAQLFVSGYMPWWKQLFGWLTTKRSVYVL